MEISSKKIPFLPSDWTINRVAGYAARLILFILVPGLHQLACRRLVFGWLLFGLYVFCHFVMTNSPFEAGARNSIPLWAYSVVEVVRYFSWLLLALDIRGLEKRSLAIWQLAPTAMVLFLGLLPLHDHGVLKLHIVTKNHACPEYCENDILTYEHFYMAKHNLKIGDYVLAGRSSNNLQLTRVMMIRSKDKCLTEYPLDWKASLDFYFCDEGARNYLYEYLVLADSESTLVTSEGLHVTPIMKGEIQAFNPKKIGNLRQNFSGAGKISEYAGNTLLVIYKWTGINLFYSQVDRI